MAPDLSTRIQIVVMLFLGQSNVHFLFVRIQSARSYPSKPPIFVSLRKNIYHYINVITYILRDVAVQKEDYLLIFNLFTNNLSLPLIERPGN